MSEAPCQHPDCTETVELPVEQPVASVSQEYVPPAEREVVVMCPRGHRSVYTLKA